MVFWTPCCRRGIVFSEAVSACGTGILVCTVLQGACCPGMSIFIVFQVSCGSRTTVFTVVQYACVPGISVFTMLQGARGSGISIFTMPRGACGSGTSVFTTFQGACGSGMSVFTVFQKPLARNAQLGLRSPRSLWESFLVDIYIWFGLVRNGHLPPAGRSWRQTPGLRRHPPLLLRTWKPNPPGGFRETYRQGGP